LRRALGRIDERQSALDQHELLDPIGKRAGEQRADRRAARVADEAESVPAERIGDVDQITDVLPNVVARVRRAEIAEAVPGGIERDDTAAAKQRREEIEAAGVVEPAVQREHGQIALAAPFPAG